MAKPFSQKLYDDNDDAKMLFITWLWNSEGIEAWVNPDQYGIDVQTAYMEYEVEVKHNWRGPRFPYETVHIPVRKKKFLKETMSFAMFNHQRSHVMLIPGTVVLQAPEVVKSTIYTADEKFFEILVKDCKIFVLEEQDDH